jgi:lysophospholipase L1-like esterase
MPPKRTFLFLMAMGMNLWPPAFGQALKIMPLGDSITRGTNDINYPNGDIPGGYRKKLGELLTAQGVSFDFVGEKTDNAAPGMDPDHNGNNGWRTDETLAELSGWLEARPHAVLLMVGTNDVVQGKPIAQAANNLENLIIEITSTLPACRLHVATILPITQAWQGRSAGELNANANAYNAEVRARVAAHAAAGRKVSLVDMNALVVLDDPDPLLDFFQPGDGIHPGQAGYDQLGQLWFAALEDAGFSIPQSNSGVPAVPSALSAAVVSPSRVNLAWTDVATNEAVYHLWQCEVHGGLWQKVATLSADATSHAVTGLSNGLDSHAFAVEAVNAEGTSGWSNVAITEEHDEKAHLRTATASSTFNNNSSFSPPKANDGQLSTRWASGSGSNHFWQVDLNEPHHLEQVVVTSSQTTDVEVHRKNFEVRASNQANFSTFTVLGAQGATALPHQGGLTLSLANPKAFRYLRVVKTDASSFSISQVHAHGIDQISLPAAPAAFAAEVLDDSHVRLSWSAVSQNEREFRLERAPAAGGGFANVAMIGGTVNSHVDSGLSASTGYRYRLVAINETGESPASAEALVTTAAQTAYDLWASEDPDFMALPDLQRDPGFDPDADGWNNLVEHAFRSDPLGTDGRENGLRMMAADNGVPGIFLRFTRNVRSPDLFYQLQRADRPDAAVWSPVSLAGARISPHPSDPGLEAVAVPVFPAPEEDRAFYRVWVVSDAETE